MGILVQTIVDRCNAALDAEGSDYYQFDKDFKPAINSAIEWITMVFNEVFASKKVTPEQLRELVRTRVWQANAYSRISYNPADTGHDLWTIISVMPEITLYPSNFAPPLVDKTKSVFLGNKTFLTSNYSCKRLSSEQWNINSKNPFMAGNVVSVGSLKEYAYRDFSDYSSSTYTNAVGAEIEIRPSVAEKPVAIEYVKYPAQVSAITDSVEFPKSMTTIIVEKTLSFMSIKQGDGTNLWSITEGDIKRLTTLFS